MRPALLLTLVLPTLAIAAPVTGDAADGWHRVVGILQYLEADYPAAIETQVAFELEEQKSFAAEAIVALEELGPSGQPFLPRLRAMQEKVNRSVEPDAVSEECGKLVADIVATTGIVQSPKRTPDLAHGEALFAKACATCHGAAGRADVAIAETMEPRPANFHDADLMSGLNPYKAFNTTSFGVPGTAMPSFPLSEHDRWSVAFFIFTLRQPPCDTTPPRVSLDELATSTDDDLAKKHGEAHVACLRRRLPKVDQDATLALARTGVEEALKLGGGGDVAAAKSRLLDAYLLGIEPVEATLRARDSSLVDALEKGFLSTRAALDKSPEAFEREARALLALLDEAQAKSGAAADFLTVFWLSFFILLRESFEALIVVAALIAVLKKMGQTQHVRVVHAGWVAALFVGAGLFVFLRHLLIGANLELMEGIVALVAVALLIYAALWLNARANIRVFMGELREKMQDSLGRGSLLGLFTVAFSAVLRESVETVIFLQGLAIDSISGVAWGVAAGAGVLMVLLVIIRRAGFVLPMKTLFSASTVLLLATAVFLLGKGIHALQEVAWLPLAPIRFFTFEPFGIFPDAVSLAPQLLLALAPMAYVWLQRRPRRTTLATSA